MRFEVLNLMSEDWSALRGASFEWVSCRNFLGYFKSEYAAACVDRLWGRVRPGGTLLLDAFCLQKYPALLTRLRTLGAEQLDDLPFFLRPSVS